MAKFDTGSLGKCCKCDSLNLKLVVDPKNIDFFTGIAKFHVECENCGHLMLPNEVNMPKAKPNPHGGQRCSDYSNDPYYRVMELFHDICNDYEMPHPEVYRATNEDTRDFVSSLDIRIKTDDLSVRQHTLELFAHYVCTLYAEGESDSELSEKIVHLIVEWINTETQCKFHHFKNTVLGKLDV